MIFLFPINLLVSFGIYSTPKLLKYVTLSPFKAIQSVQIDLYSSNLMTFAPSFILGKLFLE